METDGDDSDWRKLEGGRRFELGTMCAGWVGGCDHEEGAAMIVKSIAILKMSYQLAKSTVNHWQDRPYRWAQAVRFYSSLTEGDVNGYSQKKTPKNCDV